MTTTPATVERAREAPRAEPVPSWRMLAPIVAVLLGWTWTMWAIVGAFVAPVLPGGWLAVALGAVLAVLPVVALMRGIRDRTYPSALTRILVMRPFWYGEIAIFLLAVAAVPAFLAGLPFGAGGALARGAIAVMAVLVALLFLVGYWGSRRLVVREISFAFPDLPRAFDGLRIAQVSDLHVGPHTPKRHVANVRRALAEARADVVAITGDQVDDFDRDVEHFNRAFADVRAPLGTFVIPGNHDVYAGWDDVERGLSAAGFRVLVNDAVPLSRGGDTLWIAGTGDPAAAHASWGGGAGHAAPDIARTLARVPADAFTIALAHNPALWPALAQRGVHLTLSGHTHHGQLSVPALGWCLASPFLELAMGAHARGRSRLYINPGTNYWAVPLRIGAWPEVTVVTLRRA